MSKENETKVVEMATVKAPKTLEQLKTREAELDQINEDLINEMQIREYPVDFKTKKVFDRLLKFLEKDAPWGHTTATGLIMLYHNLRECKEIVKGKEFDGIVAVRSTSVTILWQMVTKMTGSGFYEAKSFVELMANVGESLSTAVQKVQEDNQSLRDNHSELAKVQQEISELEQQEMVEGPTAE
jgi:gas vesicle protein